MENNPSDMQSQTETQNITEKAILSAINDGMKDISGILFYTMGYTQVSEETYAKVSEIRRQEVQKEFNRLLGK